MSVIEDDIELYKILETINLDEFKLVDLPLEKHDMSQELLDVGLAPAMDALDIMGLAP